MYDAKIGTVVGTSMKELKTLTKYFNEECLTRLSLDLISYRVRGEGLIQGQCRKKMKPVTHAAI